MNRAALDGISIARRTSWGRLEPPSGVRALRIASDNRDDWNAVEDALRRDAVDVPPG